MESIAELLSNFKNTLDALNGQMANLKQRLDDAKLAVDDAVAKAYAEGFSAAKLEGGGEAPKSDKLYSQVEAEAMVAAAVEPLKLEVSDLLGKIEALNGAIAPQVEAAVAAMKADLLAKYEASQVAESTVETGFKDLLK